MKKSGGVVEKEIVFSRQQDTISDRVSGLVLKESLAVVDIEVIEEETTVYNFEVEDDHTYFVTEAEIWVHNAEKSYSMKADNISQLGLKKANETYLKYKNGEITKAEYEKELKSIQGGKYVADPSALEVVDTLDFDAGTKSGRVREESGGWFSKWYSGETKIVSIPDNDPNYDMNDAYPEKAKDKKHYSKNDDPNKLDWNFPGNNVPGPNKPFFALYVGPGRDADKNIPSNHSNAKGLATEHQGNVVILGVPSKAGTLYVSIGHTEYVNKSIVDSASLGGMILPSKTYVGKSGALGWIQVHDPNGSAKPGLHTHFTFNKKREEALRILNGKD